MNDKDLMHHRTGHDEIEQRLRAYAEARLSPSPEGVARMRASVVARSVALRDAEARRLRVERRAWLMGRTRRTATALLAASLTFGSAAAVLAAAPGSTLYDAKLWFESFSLPGSGDVRAAIQVGQLDQRINETQAAIDGRDPAAIDAALAAFESEVTAALNDAANDPARLAHLQAALAKHIVVLREVEANAPPSAVAAIEAAITSASNAIDVIESREPSNPQPQHTPPPAPDQSPHPTQKPHPTPAPTDAPAVPTPSPRPHPSHP
jgi:hypothetical protein